MPAKREEFQQSITQILYSGLGGHGSVAFSLLSEFLTAGYSSQRFVFFGVEPLKDEYASKCEKLGVPYLAIEKKQGFDARAYGEVFRHIKKCRPDIVFLHSVNLIVLLYAALFFSKTKIVAVEHQSNQLKTKIDWLHTILCLLMAHKVIYLTSEYAAEIKAKFPFFFNQRKISVIGNGIDTDYYKPPIDNTINEGIVRFGMVGRLNSLRDHETLLQTVALLKKEHAGTSFCCYVAGDGPSLTTLKKLAADLSIEDSVVFLGTITEEQILKLLQSFTIYTHMSYGETMSTAIMQAMACGLPVVATNVRGIENMINNEEDGILIPINDPTALKNIIISLLARNTFMKLLGANARRKAEEKFSNKRMFAAYINVISKLR